MKLRNERNDSTPKKSRKKVLEKEEKRERQQNLLKDEKERPPTGIDRKRAAYFQVTSFAFLHMMDF